MMQEVKARNAQRRQSLIFQMDEHTRRGHVAPRLRRVLNMAVATLVVLALGACSDEDERLKVNVCGDLAIPEHADQLRVSALDSSGAEFSSGLRDLIACPSGDGAALPQKVEIALPTGTGVVKVQAIRDGLSVMEFSRNVEFDNTDEVDVSLNLDCFNISCPTGQTCVGGRCNLIPYDDQIACESTGELPDLSALPEVTYCDGEVVTGGEGEGEGESE